MIFGTVIAAGSVYLHYGYHEQRSGYDAAIGDAENTGDNVSNGPLWLIVEWNRLVYGEAIAESETRKEEREKLDLLAQQEMAEWAFWLLCVSILGFAVSAGGLIALLISLSQTRTVIKDTREIGEGQIKAYMAVVFESISFHAGVTGYNPSAKITATNKGNSPADEVTVQMRWIICRGEEIIAQRVTPQDGNKIEKIFPAEPAGFGGLRVDFNFEVDEIKQLLQKGVDMKIWLICSYVDVFKRPCSEMYFYVSQSAKINTSVVTGTRPPQIDVILKRVKPPTVGLRDLWPAAEEGDQDSQHSG